MRERAAGRAVSDGRILRDPETVVRPAPVNLKADERELFGHEYERHFGSAFVWDLDSVVALPNGYLLDNGSLREQGFASAPRGTAALKARIRIARHLLSTTPSEIPRGLWITDEFSNGYFHWVCDALPRLEALPPGEISARTLIVPAMAAFSYVTQSLEAYHLSEVRAFSWHERIRCRHLQVIGEMAPTGNYRPELMRALRDRMRGHFAATGSGRRIYVSRSGAAVRRIANEAEIVPVLDKLGFERVEPERLSFGEQVRLMGSASILVSNHGAGLTHMCWMGAGTTVLELRRQGDRMNNCYFALAGALGMAYHYLSCPSVDDRRPTHVADLVVDPARLEHELVRIGG